MFPSTSSRKTLRLSGKQNSLFPSEAHIKCILSLISGDDTKITEDNVMKNAYCSEVIVKIKLL